jgi:hypothetical protein
MKTKAKTYRFVVEIAEDGRRYEVIPHCDNPHGLFDGAAKGELGCAAAAQIGRTNSK